MKNLLKTYCKIGMVAGPLSLWIDSYVYGDSSMTKKVEGFIAGDDNPPSPGLLRVCVATGCLWAAVAGWPIFLCGSLLDLFSTTK